MFNKEIIDFKYLFIDLSILRVMFPIDQEGFMVRQKSQSKSQHDLFEVEIQFLKMILLQFIEFLS